MPPMTEFSWDCVIAVPASVTPEALLDALTLAIEALGGHCGGGVPTPITAAEYDAMDAADAGKAGEVRNG